MKVLVVGTGSVGRRHIVNLLTLGVEVFVFSYRGTFDLAPEIFSKVEVLSDLSNDVVATLDAVVVANSTERHLETALWAAQLGLAMYIEKPLSTSLIGLAELEAMIDSKNLVVEAGFMLRSHPNLLWMKEALEQGMLGTLTYIRASVGQWLPDWRPGVDHRLGYGAFHKRGGGVILDLIHEIDVVRWLGGEIVDVCAMVRQVQLLEIETEAVAQMCFRLENGALAQAHVDYVRPRYARTLEVVGSKGVFSWDYSRGVVLHNSNIETDRLVHRVDSDFDRNLMFLGYMEHFLLRVASPEIASRASYLDGLAALRVALACHQSARERRNICPNDVDVNFEIEGIKL
jgi:predicted dehydrogenase